MDRVAKRQILKLNTIRSGQNIQQVWFREACVTHVTYCVTHVTHVTHVMLFGSRAIVLPLY